MRCIATLMTRRPRLRGGHSSSRLSTIADAPDAALVAALVAAFVAALDAATA